jgi:hypothetical protein
MVTMPQLVALQTWVCSCHEKLDGRAKEGVPVVKLSPFRLPSFHDRLHDLPIWGDLLPVPKLLPGTGSKVHLLTVTADGHGGGENQVTVLGSFLRGTFERFFTCECNATIFRKEEARAGPSCLRRGLCCSWSLATLWRTARLSCQLRLLPAQRCSPPQRRDQRTRGSLRNHSWRRSAGTSGTSFHSKKKRELHPATTPTGYPPTSMV